VFLRRLYSKDSDVHAVLRQSNKCTQPTPLAQPLAHVVGCLLECALSAMRGSSVDTWECGLSNRDIVA